jgi:hypothetical protein
MTWIRRCGFTAALLLLGSVAQAQSPTTTVGAPSIPIYTAGDSIKLVQYGMPAAQGGGAPAGAPGQTKASGEAAQTGGAGPGLGAEGAEPLGPTPLTKVNILNDLLWGEGAEKPLFRISGWIDGDYTYRSTGPGQNNVAPVQNRFGDEFLMRQIGIYMYRPLDEKELSFGFNAIFIGGADASFLGPTAGWYANTNPRFGTQFTDLNLTAHLPILTEGGVDIKAGRQTTVLGPMGALPWQRPFTSADYAWFNMEEGRYTGVSANWKISKQLSWYNGIEIGGWGVFYDNPSHGVDYIGQIVYWLDEDAKSTKVWTTVLTGPTGFHGPGNSTTFELGGLHNYGTKAYQIVDTQMVYSKQPIFFAAPPGYQQRAYDVYTYFGYHLCTQWDITTRIEWYKDVDGGGYPGGFGVPHTDYYEGTVGLNYHPYKWVEFRPEIRYDHATHPNFGELNDKKNQISIAADLFFKF